MLVCRSHTIVCHHWLINPLDIILALELPSCQCIARGSSGMHFHSVQQHKYALPCLPEIYWKHKKIWTPLYILDTQYGPHVVQIRGVPLYSSTHPMEIDIMWYDMHVQNRWKLCKCQAIYIKHFPNHTYLGVYTAVLDQFANETRLMNGHSVNPWHKYTWNEAFSAIFYYCEILDCPCI